MLVVLTRRFFSHGQRLVVRKDHPSRGKVVGSCLLEIIGKKTFGFSEDGHVAGFQNLFRPCFREVGIFQRENRCDLFERVVVFLTAKFPGMVFGQPLEMLILNEKPLAVSLSL